MPPLPSGRSESRSAWGAIAGGFVLALAIRAVFIAFFPTIHGGDAAGRLANPGTFVLGYQLPLPQMFVGIGRFASDDPVLVRGVFAVWGAALAAGGVALLTLAHKPGAGILGALLLATDPLLVHYSIVPYQEPVAYGLLAWAFYLAATGWPRAASLLMAAACLSRFEAWLFLPAFAIIARLWIATLVAGLPVGMWVLWWQGLAAGGLYVLDLDPAANRVSRVAFLGGKLIEYTTPFVALLAIAGFLSAVRQREGWIWKSSFVVGLVTAVVVTLGHEYPPGSGRMSERLIHLPVLLSLLLAASLLGRVAAHSRGAFIVCVAVGLLLAGRNLLFETRLLQAAEREPDLALARETAEAVERQRRPGECVTVLARAVDPALLDAYVLKVAASFGDTARARERAREAAQSSPDRDRIAAHLKAPPGTVRSTIASSCDLIVAIDADAPLPAAGGPVQRVGTITAGTRRADLFRRLR